MSYDRLSFVIDRICELVSRQTGIECSVLTARFVANQYRNLTPEVLRARLIVRYFAQEIYEHGHASAHAIGAILSSGSLATEWFAVKQRLRSDEPLRTIVEAVTPEFISLIQKEN